MNQGLLVLTAPQQKFGPEKLLQGYTIGGGSCQCLGTTFEQKDERVKEPTEKESNPWRWVAYFTAVVAVVVAGWFISWALITWKLGNPGQPGAFGDMFGAVNALFSGLAFAGVIVAILMQREELSLQRKVLVETRRELARSAEAQEEQVKVMRRQSETLRVTAELNARTSMMVAYATGGNVGATSPEKWQFQLAQLERVLSELDPDYTP